MMRKCCAVLRVLVARRSRVTHACRTSTERKSMGLSASKIVAAVCRYPYCFDDAKALE